MLTDQKRAQLISNYLQFLPQILRRLPNSPQIGKFISIPDYRPTESESDSSIRIKEDQLSEFSNQIHKYRLQSHKGN